MSSSAAEQSLLRLSRAPIRLVPFEHIYVRDVFPTAFYAEMVREFPAAEYFPDRQHPYRQIMAAEDAGPFWSEITQWMGGNYVASLINKFKRVRKERFGDADKFTFNVRLVRDDPEYSLTPHTDLPAKFLSFLFYLTADEAMREFGTAVYAPLDPDYVSTNGDWEDDTSKFKKVWTALFMPNTCFAFPRTDWSWHGVEPSDCGQVRRALLLNVFAC